MMGKSWKKNSNYTRRKLGINSFCPQLYQAFVIEKCIIITSLHLSL